VERSPLADLLSALDKLDVDNAMALCAPDCSLMTADGRRAEGSEATRELLQAFFSQVRSLTHDIVSQWQFEDVWIAELLANYELTDWLKIERLPRAIVVRAATDGIREVRVYGANERPLSDHRSGDEAVRIGGRLVLPL
jgi:hypothetical protein